MRTSKFASPSQTGAFQLKLLTAAVAWAWAAIPLAHAVTMPIDPAVANVPKYVIPLVIPPEMPKTGPTQACPSGASCPSTKYNIAERQFKQQILPGGVWNTVNGRADTFGATTVWSYGAAADALPPNGMAPAPAKLSSFNYPAFTVENRSQKVNTVRWINELVATDPTTGKPYPIGDTRRTTLTHLTPIDRTLHWANPEKLPCSDPATGNSLPGATNCRPYVDPVNPDARLGLSYDGPVPMVVHVHGAEVNPYSDGFPEAWWLPAGTDPKTGNPVSANYAVKGSHYDQSPLLNRNSYPGSAAFSYENTQPATTLWFHDHTLGMTANNVYAGPAGFWLIRGDYKAPNGTVVREQPVRGHLPGSDSVFQRPTNPNITYDTQPGCDPNFDAVCRANIREIPIAIQDRSFNADGSLFYPDSRAYFDGGDLFKVPYLPSQGTDVSPIHQPEFFGNMTVVNGTVWPTLSVVPQRYRFRLLAGADSRTFNLSMWAIPPGVTPPDQNSPTYVADLKAIPGVQEVPFYQIGAEQGFLPQVVKIMTGSATALPGNGIEPSSSCPVGATPTTTVSTAPTLLETMEGATDHKVSQGPTPTGCITGTPTEAPDRALLMGPAERADVIVDFSKYPAGTTIRMVNTGPDVPFNDGWFAADIANPAGTGQVMEFKVTAPTATTPHDNSTPPAWLQLSSEPANTAPNATVRQASLIEDDSKQLCVTVDPVAGIKVVQSFPTAQPDLATTCAGLTDPATGLSLGAIPFGPTETFVGTMAGGIPSPQPWANPVTEAPVAGTSETWEIYNFTVDAHPMHLHGARVQVVNREMLNLDPTTGAAAIPAVLTGKLEAPIPTEAGFKDIVIAEPGTVTRIKASFQIPGLYVWHCHIVEHEDNEMMVPICIKGAATDTACTATPGAATTGPWPIQP